MQYYSLRLTFFLEVAKKLSKFLRWFQTNWTMVPFFVDTIEEILRSFCGRFILSNVMSKAVKTVDLIKISMFNITFISLMWILVLHWDMISIFWRRTGRSLTSKLLGSKKIQRTSLQLWQIILLPKHQFNRILVDVPGL